MTRPTVAIIGASADRSKLGNKSLRAHLQAGYDVYPVNPGSESPVLMQKAQALGLNAIYACSYMNAARHQVGAASPPRPGAANRGGDAAPTTEIS